MRIGSCFHTLVSGLLVGSFGWAAGPAAGVVLPSSLPLSFEPEAGRDGVETGFLTRAGGHVIRISSRGLEVGPRDRAAAVIRFQGARRDARPEAVEPLPGKVNYLVGADRSQWRTNLPTWRRVRYHGVYEGIDLEYYGNQRDLEFDLILRPGADPGQVRLRIEGAEARLSESGDLVMRTADGALIQHRPVVYQEYGGVRRPVEAEYRRTGRQEYAFAVKDYDRRRKLVIDPVVTFAGTFAAMGATPVGIGRDAAGNGYVAGYLNRYSTALAATPGAYKSSVDDPGSGYVTKLNPGGDMVLFTTFITGESKGLAVDEAGHAFVTGTLTSYSLGPYAACGKAGDGFVMKLGANGDSAAYEMCLPGVTPVSVAIDAQGAAYVAGRTLATDLKVNDKAAQPKSGGRQDGFIAKVDPDGVRLEYLTYLGGSGDDQVIAVAVDKAGQAYVTGSTASADFPAVRARQPLAGSPTVKWSDDRGLHWTQAGRGLPESMPKLLATHPNDRSQLLLSVPRRNGNGEELYRSADAGVSWTPAGPIPTEGIGLFFDAKNPGTYFLASRAGWYRTVDGGANWKAAGLFSYSVSGVAVDERSALVYLADGGVLRRSRDGGTTWEIVDAGGNKVWSVHLDPTNTQVLYVTTYDRKLLRSRDGGTNWSEPRGQYAGPSNPSLYIAPSDPNVLYLTGSDTYMSEDGGESWVPVYNVQIGAVDPADAHLVYMGFDAAVYRLRVEHGQVTERKWVAPGGMRLRFDSGTPARLYAASVFRPDAFVTKLSADGSAWIYSGYFGGNGTELARGIAVDDGQGVWLAGATNSTDLPTTETAAQRLFSESEDAWSGSGSGMAADGFVMKLDSAGQLLQLSTYLGGAKQDDVTGLGLDAQGALYVAGTTSSGGFPFTPDSAVPVPVGGNPKLISGSFLVRIPGGQPYVEYSGYFEQLFSGLVLDGMGNVLLTGTGRSSAAFPLVKDGAVLFEVVRFGEGTGRPEVAAGGVVDPFTMKTRRAAPGSIVAVFGAGLAGQDAVSEEPPLPLELVGTSVTVDGLAAPLMMVSPGRVNFQLPYETQPGRVSQVVIRTAQGESLPAALVVSRAAPNIAVDPESLRALAVNEDGSANGPDNPARVGSVVTLYLTGFGVVENGPATGAAAAEKARAVLASSVKLGKKEGTVEYLGVTPGKVGLGQAEIRIPPLPSSEYPLVLTLDGVKSNWCLISVVAQ
ncbi:SBBP repeat-containing protein [Paludibaculum fermentans]|uniref:DUF7948 domain-containing protein n=1 Tax=Paludibaculum fermentans TaxID=1473598 RepID=UPI003EBB8ED7